MQGTPPFISSTSNHYLGPVVPFIAAFACSRTQPTQAERPLAQADAAQFTVQPADGRAETHIGSGLSKQHETAIWLLCYEFDTDTDVLNTFADAESSWVQPRRHCRWMLRSGGRSYRRHLRYRTDLPEYSSLPQDRARRESSAGRSARGFAVWI